MKAVRRNTAESREKESTMKLLFVGKPPYSVLAEWEKSTGRWGLGIEDMREQVAPVLKEMARNHPERVWFRELGPGTAYKVARAAGAVSSVVDALFGKPRRDFFLDVEGIEGEVGELLKKRFVERPHLDALSEVSASAEKFERVVAALLASAKGRPEELV